MKSGVSLFLVYVIVIGIHTPQICFSYEQFALMPRVSLLFDTERGTGTADIKYGNGNGVGLTALAPAWSSQVAFVADYYTYEAEAFVGNASVAARDLQRVNLRLYYLDSTKDWLHVGSYPVYFGYGFFYNYVEYAAPFSSAPEDVGNAASIPFSFESLELLRLHSFGVGGDLIFHRSTENGLFFNASLGAKSGFGDPGVTGGLRVHTDGRSASWSGLSYSVNIGFERDLVTWCYGFSVGYLGLLEQSPGAYEGSSDGRKYLLDPAWLQLSALTIQGFVRF